ncbi:MAG: right-handed parallel beta-helix repeat-containing protein [Planctomycetes bacterium]|nr:right-handed parallel beta-helix repeat-containing protein [Planctomycetota bacterium]
MKPLTIGCLALCFTSAASAAVIKVPQDQATIALAVAAASAGDTILVKAGVYEENVTIASGLTGLKIQGLGLVIVDARPNGATASGPGFDVQADNVTLQNLMIRHAKGVNANGVVSSSNGIVLNAVRVQHADGAGISVTGNDAFLNKCEVVDSGGGIVITGNGAEVVKALVHRDSAEGITITGDDATITKCAVRAIDGTGIVVVGANATIQSNEIRRVDDAVVVQGTNALIAKNVVDACSGDGIKISSAASGTIEKNTVTDMRDSCLVVVSDASGLSIDKNNLRRTGSSDAVAVIIDGDGNSMTNSLVRQCAGDGIVVSGDNNTLFKVTSSEHGEDGIQFTGTGNSADKCVFRKNQGEGAQCDGANNALTKTIAKLNRIDVAASVPFATFTANAFTTGGNAAAPEIDD